uniref:Uncharacterized protein n=1 Tax=Oryza brachyantha TaxID=4533 RepID=J3MGB7_ORYBR
MDLAGSHRDLHCIPHGKSGDETLDKSSKRMDFFLSAGQDVRHITRVDAFKRRRWRMRACGGQHRGWIFPSMIGSRAKDPRRFGVQTLKSSTSS